MVGEMRVRVNEKSETLTILPVLQSQTIKVLSEDVETKSINLEALIFAHGTSTLALSKPVSHEMTLLSGRW